MITRSHVKHAMIVYEIQGHQMRKLAVIRMLQQQQSFEVQEEASRVLEQMVCKEQS